MLDVVGDLPRGSTIGISGEDAIQVASVQGTHACSGEDGGKIQCRQDDEGAADVAGFELLNQPCQHDLALVFVSVVAGTEH